MSDNPTVSVVIPAYNAARWIGETLDSILAQAFQDFEVIVVNDGSTDDTAAVVAGFGDRVYCIHKPNGGQASARNVGIRAAKGEYIAFVDADDLWAKEKLQLQVDLLKRTGLAWVYCDAFAFDDTNGARLHRIGNVAHQYDGDILKTLFFADFIPSPTPVIRRSVFEHVGYFDEDRTVRNREDWDMWLRIAACYPIGLVSEPLADYRVHSTSMTGNEDPQVFLQGHFAVIERAIAREPTRLGPLKNREMANRFSQVAGIYAQREMWLEAQRMYIQAMRILPGQVRAYAGWAACFWGGWFWRIAFDLRRQLFWRR